MKKYYDFDYVEMGKRIAKRRKELLLSQKELAELVDCEYAYMSKIEKGRARPTLGLIRLIAIKLDVGVDYFITGTKGYSRVLDTEIAEELKQCSAAEKSFIKEFILRVKAFGDEVAKEYET